jgi:hypothetical protein
MRAGKKVFAALGPLKSCSKSFEHVYNRPAEHNMANILAEARSAKL